MTATALARRHGCSSLGAWAHASLTAGGAYNPAAAAATPNAGVVLAVEESGLARRAGALDCDSGFGPTHGAPCGEAAAPTASMGNLQRPQAAEAAATGNSNLPCSIMPGLQQRGGTAVQRVAAPQPPFVAWLSPWHSAQLSQDPQPHHLLPSALVVETGGVTACVPSRTLGYPPPFLPAIAGALGPTPSGVAVASAAAAVAAAAVAATALQGQVPWLRRALSTAGPPTSGAVMRALEAPTRLAQLQETLQEWQPHMGPTHYARAVRLAGRVLQWELEAVRRRTGHAAAAREAKRLVREAQQLMAACSQAALDHPLSLTAITEMLEGWSQLPRPPPPEVLSHVLDALAPGLVPQPQHYPAKPTSFATTSTNSTTGQRAARDRGPRTRGMGRLHDANLGDLGRLLPVLLRVMGELPSALMDVAATIVVRRADQEGLRNQSALAQLLNELGVDNQQVAEALLRGLVRRELESRNGWRGRSSKDGRGGKDPLAAVVARGFAAALGLCRRSGSYGPHAYMAAAEALLHAGLEHLTFRELAEVARAFATSRHRHALLQEALTRQLLVLLAQLEQGEGRAVTRAGEDAAAAEGLGAEDENEAEQHRARAQALRAPPTLEQLSGLLHDLAVLQVDEPEVYDKLSYAAARQLMGPEVRQKLQVPRLEEEDAVERQVLVESWQQTVEALAAVAGQLYGTCAAMALPVRGPFARRARGADGMEEAPGPPACPQPELLAALSHCLPALAPHMTAKQLSHVAHSLASLRYVDPRALGALDERAADLLCDAWRPKQGPGQGHGPGQVQAHSQGQGQGQEWVAAASARVTQSLDALVGPLVSLLDAARLLACTCERTVGLLLGCTPPEQQQLQHMSDSPDDEEVAQQEGTRGRPPAVDGSSDGRPARSPALTDVSSAANPSQMCSLLGCLASFGVVRDAHTVQQLLQALLDTANRPTPSSSSLPPPSPAPSSPASIPCSAQPASLLEVLTDKDLAHLFRFYLAACDAGLQPAFLAALPDALAGPLLARVTATWHGGKLGAGALRQRATWGRHGKAYEELQEAMQLLGLPAFGECETSDGLFRVRCGTGVGGVMVGVEFAGDGDVAVNARSWLVGDAAFRARGLEARGWRLVLVPWWEWEAAGAAGGKRGRVALLERRVAALVAELGETGGPGAGGAQV